MERIGLVYQPHLEGFFIVGLKEKEEKEETWKELPFVPPKGVDKFLWEHSPDGENIPVDIVPSQWTEKVRYAKRLKKKYGLSFKKAMLISYMLLYISGGKMNKNITDFYELEAEIHCGFCGNELIPTGIIRGGKFTYFCPQCVGKVPTDAENKWEFTFKKIKKLFFELMAEEPIELKGKMNDYNGISPFGSIPIIPEPESDEKKNSDIEKIVIVYEVAIEKCRTTIEIKAVGRWLYRQLKKYPYRVAAPVWGYYKQRKEKLLRAAANRRCPKEIARAERIILSAKNKEEALKNLERAYQWKVGPKYEGYKRRLERAAKFVYLSLEEN